MANHQNGGCALPKRSLWKKAWELIKFLEKYYHRFYQYFTSLTNNYAHMS
jgi:hypothetical protein